MKTRLDYIDRLRGVNILLVVMGHFIQYNTIESTNNSIWVYGIAFKMPVFMFICGYIAHKTVSDKIFDNYGTFVLKKGRTLLIPFFVWPLVVNNFFFTTKMDHNLLDQFVNLIKNGSGLWFLWYLFFFTILYTLFLFISNIVNKKANLIYDLAIGTGILLFLFIFRYLKLINYIDSLILYFAFYLVGVCISKYAVLRRYLMNEKVFSLAVLTFAIVVGWYKYEDKSSLNSLIKLVTSSSAIVIMYYTVRNIAWNHVIDKYVRCWGVNSLIIYTTHFAIITVLYGTFILPPMSFVLTISITLLFSLIVIMFCLGFHKIIKLSPFLDHFLYGNKVRKIKEEIISDSLKATNPSEVQTYNR